MIWKLLHPQMTMEYLGFLPQMVSEHDPRPAAAQFDTSYAHGGGWQPFDGFELRPDNSLTYPGDPPVFPLAEAKLRDELIVFYPLDWVAIIQPDRSFQVSRMD